MNRYTALIHRAQRAESKWQGAKSPQPDHYGIPLTVAVEWRGRLDVGCQGTDGKLKRSLSHTLRQNQLANVRATSWRWQWSSNEEWMLVTLFQRVFPDPCQCKVAE